MLVKPSELQAQIALRSSEHPVGNKKHKQGRSTKGKGKGGGKQAVSVDPALLRLDHGIFQSVEGLSLSQISLPQVGPSAAGVAVVSVGMIEPYLQAGHPCRLVLWPCLWLMLLRFPHLFSGYIGAGALGLCSKLRAAPC